MNIKSWPFEEANKIINRINKLNKTEVILETGYGPSGLPHIGTFGEVLRTTAVMQAFNKLSNIPTKLIVFSDDMDGFRKVPTNVPNSEMLSKYIDYPLTEVPDPFGKFESFAHHNNAMLKSFLDSFGFKYEFKSATETYKSGEFNEYLKRVLRRFDEIMNIMLPSLREERKKTYSPILPISPVTKKILQVHIDDINLQDYTITYKNPETQKAETISILNGNCKLQWKADWGMRWAALGIDYEMNGKDLIDSYKLSSKICKTIGGNPPENLAYELFLDEEGTKISKSKGNGLSIEEWLKYAPPESLAYYMFQTPKRAKRLYFDVIPSAMDDYIDSVQKYGNYTTEEQLKSPIYHIHNGNPPQYKDALKFSLLLNLVQACNTDDEKILMKFILKYLKQPTKETTEFMQKLAKYCVKYYKDFVSGKRICAIPDLNQRQALEYLIEKLKDCSDEETVDKLQNLVFEVGKKYYSNDLKIWFISLYRILFGADSGPRMGSFISLYGIKNTINLINERLSYAN